MQASTGYSDLAIRVHIAAGEMRLPGELAVVDGARGLVILAAAEANSRQPEPWPDPLREVASALNRAGFATLVFDIVAAEAGVPRREAARFRSDVELYAWRLLAATDWAAARANTAGLRVGYFGTGNAAVAALAAAAERSDRVDAVVSCGGHAGVIGDQLGRLRVPTLLLVSEHDEPGRRSNEGARALSPAHIQITEVRGAGPMLGKPETLNEVTKLARDWFRTHISGASGSEDAAKVVT